MLIPTANSKILYNVYSSFHMKAYLVAIVHKVFVIILFCIKSNDHYND